MDMESQRKPTNAVGKEATHSRGFFNGAISSRIKQMMQRKKEDATTSAGPQQPSTGMQGHGKSATESMAASSSTSASASTSASTSGSESPAPSKPNIPANSRKGTSLFERMMPSRKRKLKSAEVQSGLVEYVFFDDDGNPAWSLRAKHSGMEMDSDSDKD